jgi:hypothetical protein
VKYVDRKVTAVVIALVFGGLRECKVHVISFAVVKNLFVLEIKECSAAVIG